MTKSEKIMSIFIIVFALLIAISFWLVNSYLKKTEYCVNHINYVVEKDGVTFKNGVLSINAINKKCERIKVHIETNEKIYPIGISSGGTIYLFKKDSSPKK